MHMACIILPREWLASSQKLQKGTPPGEGGFLFGTFAVFFWVIPWYTMAHPKETFVVEVEIIKSEMESS